MRRLTGFAGFTAIVFLLALAGAKAMAGTEPVYGNITIPDDPKEYANGVHIIPPNQGVVNDVTFSGVVNITGGDGMFISGSTVTFDKAVNVNSSGPYGGLYINNLTYFDDDHLFLNDLPSTVTFTGAVTVDAAAGDGLQIHKNANVTFASTVDVGTFISINNPGTVNFASNVIVPNLGIGWFSPNGTGDITFGGNITGDGTGGITINGNHNVTVTGNITGFKDLEIMDGAATTQFNGAIIVENMAIDTKPGLGHSTNTFDGAINLTDGTPQDGVALAITDGTNTFKNITFSNADKAVFWSTTTTINGKLDAKGGDIIIGWDEALFASVLSSPEDDINEFRSRGEGKVILGSSGNLTGNVLVYDRGHLALAGDAAITGNVSFAAGSTFSPDVDNRDVNTLAVSGTATVQDGAILSLGNLNISGDPPVFLTAGSIIGEFTNSLYRLKNTGTNYTIDSRRDVAEVVDNALGGGGTSQNAENVASLIQQILGDGSAPTDLINKLLKAVETAGNLALADKTQLAKIAFTQLFAENALSAMETSHTIAQTFNNSILNHQVQIRSNRSNLASVTSDAALASPNFNRNGGVNPNRVWLAGFGAFTRQSDKNNQFGYKYNSGGFILGYDREWGDFDFGFTGAYSSGRVKNNEGFTRTDVDTMNLGLYGSYNHCSGFFVDANAGYGAAWNKTATTDAVSGIGSKEGKYRNDSFQSGLKIGYALTLPSDFRLIPSVGLEYTHVRQNGWSETVNSDTMLANWFDKSNNNYLSLPVALKFNKTFNIGPCATLTPEIRAAWIYEAKDPKTAIRMGYVGYNGSTVLHGIGNGRQRGLVGGGLKAKFNQRADVFVDYNFEFRNKYQNHNVVAGFGVSF